MNGITQAVLTFVIIIPSVSCNSSGRTPTLKSVTDTLTKAQTDSAIAHTLASGHFVKGQDTTTPIPAPSTASSDYTSRWKYTDNEDPLGDQPIHRAAVEANENVIFHEPYGTVSAYIILTYKRHTQSAAIKLSSGQFNWGGDDLPIFVKFDDGKIRTYYCNEVSNGSPNIAIINGPSKFINKLLKAKTVLIEAEFFQEGTRDITFDVHGLQW